MKVKERRPARKKKDKEAKVTTARDLWVPAVNAHRGFGQWAFIEVTDPWNTQTLVRAFLRKLHETPKEAVA